MHVFLCMVTISMLLMTGVSEATQLKIILRYDDYSRSSDIQVEQSLFDSAKKVGSGVLVGVIPFPELPYPRLGEKSLQQVRLNEQKISLLKRYATQGIIEIGVHGFNHRNNVIKKTPAEFKGLPGQQQTVLLKMAKASLEDAVHLTIGAFIPPFNQYDKQTLKSLKSNNYKLISAGFSGPVLGNEGLNYLPGGPYLQNLKKVVSSALAKGHTDALIIVTIHPYDIKESGDEMPNFRNKESQLSSKDIGHNLEQIKQLENVIFLSTRETFGGIEDLSAERLQENLKLKSSFVTQYHLLPKVLNIYPLSGLYYSLDSAKKMYFQQMVVCMFLYSAIFLVSLFIGMSVPRYFHIKHISTIIVICTLSVFSALLAKAFFSGVYMKVAIGLIFCIGILMGTAFNKYRSKLY